MRKTVVLFRRQARKDFDVLAVIDFEVGEQEAAVVFENLKRLLKSEKFAVESARLCQVAHFEANVSDSHDWRALHVLRRPTR